MKKAKFALQIANASFVFITITENEVVCPKIC